MSDLAVCSFITKILCARGGAINSKELPQHLELPDQQLEQILKEAGKEHFLVSLQGFSSRVLALTSLKLCLRNECEGCEHLHICRNYIKGRCYRPTRGRGACKYSHDILSEANRKVLKNHELSGLNEDELRVLLLQNDPFLLPDVCFSYNKGDGSCPQQDDCNRLHVCRYFLKGSCRFPRCKRSHNLLQPNALKLLIAEGVDDKMAWNIQTICTHKCEELTKELGTQKACSPNRPTSTSGEKKKPTAVFEDEYKPSPVQNSPPFVFVSRNLQQKEPDVKTTPAPKPPQNKEKKSSDEICLFYIWQFCKHRNNCEMIHYHLPYRWQVYTGSAWNDITQMEEVEKAYCDPALTSHPYLNINFKTMMSYVNPVRRQSTPSSVTKLAKFIFTTKWLWYWKNDQGKWIGYGEQDGQRQGSTLSSDDLENLYLSQPDGTFQFQAGSQNYEINFKDMIQKNLNFLTQREVRRRPKYVSSEDVKKKKGYRDQSSTSTPESKYPREWDRYALPEIGYKAVELSKICAEYTTIENLFQKTMSAYVIHSIRRIQNPSLWQVFQWIHAEFLARVHTRQKEQMKKKKGGKEIEDKLLFHGTTGSNLEAICNDNFDWRICGTNGTVYGKGSYFARDAKYSHNYCPLDAKVKSLFVARVLVGDFVVGHSTYNRPPPKSSDGTNCYDSCVDRMMDPSIYVIFEKHQIYPAYVISYSEEKKCILA